MAHETTSTKKSKEAVIGRKGHDSGKHNHDAHFVDGRTAIALKRKSDVIASSKVESLTILLLHTLGYLLLQCG